jgi:hypothetical protein
LQEDEARALPIKSCSVDNLFKFLNSLYYQVIV